MSENQQTTVEEKVMSAKDEAAKTSALIAYGLMILGLFTGITWIVGAIWAMVKKSEAQGTPFEDHYSNVIRTFWWSVGFSILGIILAFFFIGYFILLAVWIWSIYRIVKGLAKITSNKSYNS